MEKKSLKMTRWFWLDLEMTGLDAQQDVILEIAALVTDANLNLIAEGPSLVISQPAEKLALMDDWNKTTHKNSGLLDLVRQSQISLAQAEQQILSFARAHCELQVAPLCGNSIYQDRLFLIKHMPSLNNFLHYRVVDVSTVKILVQNWYNFEKVNYTKNNTHRGLADIYESIAELKFYRQNFFVQE